MSSVTSDRHDRVEAVRQAQYQTAVRDLDILMGQRASAPIINAASRVVFETRSLLEHEKEIPQ